MSSLSKIEVDGVEYDLYGTGGDVLPVGTEMEIASSATIPNGWEEIEYDTGWVDLDIDTNIVSIRESSPDVPDYYTPQVRRVGNIVYSKGNITWTSAHKSGEVFTTLPEKFRPDDYEIKFASGLWLGGSGTICTNYNEVNWVDMSGSWLASSPNTKKIKKITQTIPSTFWDKYSEDEIEIGTWEDKPLYRKIFTVENPTKDTHSYMSYVGYNIDEVVRLDGTAVADGIRVPVNFFYSPDVFMYAHDVSADKQIKYKFTTWDISKIYFVLEYTKTSNS